MEPLYTTETAYTFEEFKKYNIALTIKKVLLIFLILFLYFVLFTLLWRNLAFLIIGVIFTAIFGIIFSIVMNKSIKRLYYSDKYFQKNYMHQFSFYQYYFEIKTCNSFTKFDYEDIHSIKETKTNFYIMKSVNQGYLIVKANCSPELIEFLSNMKK